MDLAHPDLVVNLDEWQAHVQKLAELRAEHEAKKRAWEEASKQPFPEGARAAKAPNPPLEPGGRNAPATVYNAMLHPLVPYTIRGVLWYQGESDAGTPAR